MSFARLTDDCDVYIFDHVDADTGLVCWNCCLASGRAQHVAFGRDGHAGLLSHIAEHRAAGDRVPEYVDEELRIDAVTGDRG